MQPRTIISFHILLVFIFFCLNCATPIGQYKESDFTWKEKIIMAKYDEVYTRVLNGFRKWGQCVAEGNIYSDKKAGHFDIYLKALGHGRSDFVIGMIDLQEQKNGTTLMRTGSLRPNSPIFGGELWFKFAEGDYSDLENR